MDAGEIVYVLYYADEMDGSEWVRGIFASREAAELAAEDGDWIMEVVVKA